MVYLYFVYLFLIELTLPRSGNLWVWHTSLHHPLLLSTWRHVTAQYPTITSPVFHPSAPTSGSLQMEAPSLVPAACLEITCYICWGKMKCSLTVTLTHTLFPVAFLKCQELFFLMLRSFFLYAENFFFKCWELTTDTVHRQPMAEANSNKSID